MAGITQKTYARRQITFTLTFFTIMVIIIGLMVMQEKQSREADIMAWLGVVISAAAVLILVLPGTNRWLGLTPSTQRDERDIEIRLRAQAWTLRWLEIGILIGMYVSVIIEQKFTAYVLTGIFVAQNLATVARTRRLYREM